MPGFLDYWNWMGRGTNQAYRERRGDSRRNPVHIAALRYEKHKLVILKDKDQGPRQLRGVLSLQRKVAQFPQKIIFGQRCNASGKD